MRSVQAWKMFLEDVGWITWIAIGEFVVGVFLISIILFTSVGRVNGDQQPIVDVTEYKVEQNQRELQAFEESINERVAKLEAWKERHQDASTVEAQRMSVNEVEISNLVWMSRATLGGMGVLLLSSIVRIIRSGGKIP